MKKLHLIHLEAGYEGTMIKNHNAPYQQGKRSSDLLKYKDFKDEEFQIMGVAPMKNRPECGVVELLGYRNKIFRATPKGSYEYRKELLLNKKDIIGKWGTVTYFNLTEAGIPRFPVFKGVRED